MSPESYACFAAGGLQIIVEAIVISARWFTADNRPCAVVQVLGNRGGPMGHQFQSHPYPIFELDAEMSVYQQLADFFDQNPNTPACGKFKADLKPVNISGRYVVHLLEALEICTPAENSPLPSSA
jgi:hypothetical protein